MLAPEWAPHPRSLRPVNVRGPGRVAVVAGATAPRAARRVNETAADVCADQLATATVTSAPAVHGLSCMAARGRWGFPPPTTGVQADHACFIFSAQRCFQRRVVGHPREAAAAGAMPPPLAPPATNGGGGVTWSAGRAATPPPLPLLDADTSVTWSAQRVSPATTLYTPHPPASWATFYAALSSLTSATPHPLGVSFIAALAAAPPRAYACVAGVTGTGYGRGAEQLTTAEWAHPRAGCGHAQL